MANFETEENSISNSNNADDNPEPSLQSDTIEPTLSVLFRHNTNKKVNLTEQPHTDSNPFQTSIQTSQQIQLEICQADAELEPDLEPELPTVDAIATVMIEEERLSQKIRKISFHRVRFSFDLSKLRQSTREILIEQKVCSAKFLIYDRHHLNKFYILLINLIMPSISIFLVSMLAYHFKEPFIFPSLGPTAFLHFAIPDHPPSSPHNTIFGHLIGISVGYTALIITGLQEEKAVFVDGITTERIICAALAIGITCFLMIILQLNHPPAAATALIVALGILKTFVQFGIMMCSVVIFTIQSFILNRILRSDAVYPVWRIDGDALLDHYKKLFRCRYIYNSRTRACALCKYDRLNMKFVHVLLINLLCPAVGFCVIGIIGFYSNLPLLFPSLGPTAFIQFAIFQEAPASPKNTLLGHLIGILFGFLGLLIFGLTDNPSVAVEGISMYRIGCIVFALGFTCALMVLFKLGHPPAAATTLIVAMGILKEYIDLAVLMGSVVICTMFAFVMNRMLRHDAVYPVWGKIMDAEHTIHRTLRRQDALHGVLEEEMGYHHFPTL